MTGIVVSLWVEFNWFFVIEALKKKKKKIKNIRIQQIINQNNHIKKEKVIKVNKMWKNNASHTLI